MQSEVLIIFNLSFEGVYVAASQMPWWEIFREFLCAVLDLISGLAGD